MADNLTIEQHKQGIMQPINQSVNQSINQRLLSLGLIRGVNRRLLKMPSSNDTSHSVLL